MQLCIPVHSFVDTITNSSSELFVCADRKTIDHIKEVVNQLLNSAGSDKTCDDLFRVTLKVEDGGYGNYHAICVTALHPEDATAAQALENLSGAFTAERIGND